jgi:hypothetical protein
MKPPKKAKESCKDTCAPAAVVSGSPVIPLPLLIPEPKFKENIEKIYQSCCCALKPHAVTLPEVDFDREMLWGRESRFWRDRNVLRVRFINGDTRQRSRMWEQFKQMDELCGIAFKKVDRGPSECRVLFNMSSGHWSYVGTDNLEIPQQYQTMNFALTGRDSDLEYNRVGKHEIMHLLGFHHEHQHPRSVIPWNKPAVYNFYGRTQGWSRSEINQQVLNREQVSMADFFGGPQDKDSLMMYPIPEQLVLDKKYAVGWNTKLSAQDLEYLRKAYP